MRISTIIPCYNEEESVALVIDSLVGVDEIIVVDNNCTDKTAQIATAKGARVVTESRKGYGAAIKAGLAVATGDILSVLDGDGQYPGNKVIEIARYLDAHNIDFISCSRFPLTDKTVMTSVRKLGNFLLTLATNILFFTHIKDSQSGMWLFRSGCLKKYALSSDDMEFSEEIKIKAALDPTIVFDEYRIDYFSRKGDSKLFPLKHGVLNLLFLLKLRLSHSLYKNFK